MLSTNIHEFPILPNEQSRQATANNTAELLIHVQNVIDDVFSTIGNRIEETKTELESLNSRARVAQAKVEKLTGATKATKVFSSAKYPGQSEYKPFKLLHKSKDGLKFQPKPVKINDPEPYDPSVLKERLHFFHVRNESSSDKKNPFGKLSSHEDGLGRLPPHLNSVSSLLLYNTTHNPYKKYMVLDPLGVVSGTRQESGNRSRSGTDESVLHDAPLTIQDSDQVGMLSKDEFQYLPDPADLPQLELPMELPSLQGIANDLLYEGDIGPGIAPSIGLPGLPGLDAVDLPELPLEDIPDLPSGDVIPPPPPTIVPPPPPMAPPTPPPAPLLTPSNTVVPPPPPMPPVQSVPPPPPPPPPPIAPPTTGVEKDVAIPQNVPAAVASDSRSDLMKAIQAAGGAGKAKLKSVTERKKKAKKQDEAPVAPAGDLMADLARRLGNRRKGISGTKNETEAPAQNSAETLSGPAGTLQKMSCLIPPPNLNEDSSDENQESDDDWDD